MINKTPAREILCVNSSSSLVENDTKKKKKKKETTCAINRTEEQEISFVKIIIVN